MAENAGLIWHYTTYVSMQEAMASGGLLPDAGRLPGAAKAAVWFSTNPQWDQSANTIWRTADGRVGPLTQIQTHEIGGGLMRIGVSASLAPLDWKQFKLASGISSADSKAFYDRAVKQGARPGEWRFALEAVPLGQWRSIERWDGEHWYLWNP